MIFIVGGKKQGKTEYAKSLEQKGYVVCDDFQEFVKANMDETGDDFSLEYEKLEPQIASYLDETFANCSNEKCVVVGMEMGYGVVPMDFKDRKLRELNGRANCYLAKKADCVVRMVCGIPTVIKGSL